MVNPAVATAYRGEAAQSALALNLPEHIIKLGDNALAMLTSKAPDFDLPARPMAVAETSGSPQHGNVPDLRSSGIQIG